MINLLTFIFVTNVFALDHYSGRINDRDVDIRIEHGAQGPELVLKYNNAEALHLEYLRRARTSRIDPGLNDAGDRAHWRVLNPPTEFSVRLNSNDVTSRDWDLMNFVDYDVQNMPQVKRLLAKFYTLSKARLQTSAVAQRELPSQVQTARRYLRALEVRPEKRTREQRSVLSQMETVKPMAYETPMPVAPVADFSLKEHALLAVHHYSGGGDSCNRTGAELDRIITAFKAAKAPVVFLSTADYRTAGSWVGRRRDPDHVVYSFVGEHDIPIHSNEITLTGGYLGMCLSQANQETIRQHFRVSQIPIKLNIPMAATYVNDPGLRSQEQYQKDNQCPATVDDYHKRAGTAEMIRRLFAKNERSDGRLFGAEWFGKLNESDYTIEFLIDGKTSAEAPPMGSGPRKVIFQFWSGNNYPLPRPSGGGTENSSAISR